MDKAYQTISTAIAHVADCSAVEPHGIAKIMAEMYPSTSPHSLRKRLGHLDRARLQDRSTPGTIRAWQSNDNSPVVVNLFATFYTGQPIESNESSQRLVTKLRWAKKYGLESEMSFDSHFYEGLRQDTIENRLKFFRDSMRTLWGLIRGPCSYIRELVIPYSVTDMDKEDWKKHYLPVIRRFAEQVSPKLRVVVLVV